MSFIVKDSVWVTLNQLMEGGGEPRFEHSTMTRSYSVTVEVESSAGERSMGNAVRTIYPSKVCTE